MADQNKTYHIAIADGESTPTSAAQKIIEQKSAQIKQITELMAVAADWGNLPSSGIDAARALTGFGTKSTMQSALAMVDTKDRIYQALLSSENLMRGIQTDVEQFRTGLAGIGEQTRHDLNALTAQASMIKLWEPPAVNFAVFGRFEDTQKQFAQIASALASALVTTKEQARYGLNTYAEWVEQERRFLEACAILGIDPDTMDEYYGNLPVAKLYQEAEAAKQISQIIKESKVSEHTLYRLLLSPKPSKPGQKEEKRYDKAFERICIPPTIELAPHVLPLPANNEEEEMIDRAADAIIDFLHMIFEEEGMMNADGVLAKGVVAPWAKRGTLPGPVKEMAKKIIEYEDEPIFFVNVSKLWQFNIKEYPTLEATTSIVRGICQFI